MEKTGKVVKIKDDKYSIIQNDRIIESGDLSTLDKTVIGDYVTLEVQNSRGSDPYIGDYVNLKYLYDFNSGSNYYKDAFATAWDTEEIYAYDVIYTDNLTISEQSVGWEGFDVDKYSTYGCSWTLAHPRDEPPEDAHGEYMAEYAHAYGAPANFTFSGTLFGFISIGYTTQGSVDKDFVRDAF